MEYVPSGTPGPGDIGSIHCTRWHWEHSLYQYHLIHDRWSLPSVQRALHPFQGWGLAIVQWAPHPSWEIRFTQCATSPSSIIRMRFSQCSVGPSSFLRDDVCSSPSSLTEPERCSLPCVQPAPHPWEMKLPVCNQPLIPPERWGLSSVQPPLIPPERRSLPSVQPAPHPREMKFTSVQPALLRMRFTYLIPSER